MSAKWPLHPPVKGMRLSSASKRHLQKLADTEVESANAQTAKEKAKAKTLRKSLKKLKAKIDSFGDLEARVADLVWDVDNVHAPRLQELELARGILGPEGRLALYDAIEALKTEEE